MKLRALAALLGACMLLEARVGQCDEQKWPVLAEFSTAIGIETAAESIFWDFPLIDVHGRAQYRFRCRGGSEEYLNKLSDKVDVNYVGPFACWLIQGDSDTEASLLSEDESPYWYSRGQVHDFHELLGACGRYPEYGDVRHFRLRGFVLTLDFGDIEVDKQGNPTYFTLTVSLRRDPTAHSAQAEQTGYLTPYKAGRNCATVLRGNEPRMCSDWEHGGGWTECDKLKK